MADNEVKGGLDVATRVADKAEEWANLGEAKKLEYLHGILRRLDFPTCDEWAKLHAQHVVKAPTSDDGEVDIARHGHLIAEGFVAGPAMLGGYTSTLVKSYQEYLRNNGGFLNDTYPATRASEEEGSDHIVSVFPGDVKEKILAYGMSGELYLDGAEPLTRGKTFQAEKKEPGLVLVLGAGNFAAPIEILTKMFCEHKVCVYKPNPVNGAVTGPMLRRVLADLVEDGYLDFVDGDINVASAVIHAACTKQVMLTGSDRTYDAIVWGSPGNKEEQDQKKQQGARALDKQVDAELGNVNTVSIVPGEYTEKELRQLARHVAHVRVFNGGHTCPSPQIMLMSKDWPQRETFCDLVKEFMSTHLPSPSYYPGADRKREQFQKEFADTAEDVKYKGVYEPTVGFLEPLWVPDITTNEELFQRTETFCPVIGARYLEDAATPELFCPLAAEYVNEKTWGNLSTTVLASNLTLSTHRGVLRQMVNDLRFGAVGVNIWGGLCVFFGQLHWGAFPGNLPEDVQSGLGLGVGNFLQYDNLKKAVLWCPSVHDFQQGGHPNPHLDYKVAYRLCDFNVKQSYWSLTKVACAMMLGF
mmetsp:Transcript_486/g.1268  ORF Transcript_486/g.1268 Transcript_486/m.1268 type:complete len:584 (+) Transcript_486:118-1869(+)|eukprot:CAMPEP_0119122272 /NCGR_PEP_ID=MMETSP1310-20130426/2573_1 /TAXON_ID=464262 /ORGANISM="Genus nov. species nov., Strain RCC2339" /LENGTH=583 /DNA_ID=CAMNT_0007111905 /DNA_START=151 /DNA_END=1902 /DNA_ORIENTATION=+